MTTVTSCEELKGRLRAICDGTASGLTTQQCDAYRARWGLPPLCDATQSEPPRQENAQIVEPEDAAMPPLLIRGWNFATAIGRWTLAGMPRRSQDQIDGRLAICQACEFLRNEHCTKCGCACNEQNRLINKLALATERCPMGKWPDGEAVQDDKAGPPASPRSTCEADGDLFGSEISTMKLHEDVNMPMRPLVGGIGSISNLTEPAPDTVGDDLFARLPEDVVAALSDAVQAGRYLMMVVRLDSPTSRLEMFRHVRDIPDSDFKVIVELLREDLGVPKE